MFLLYSVSMKHTEHHESVWWALAALSRIGQPCKIKQMWISASSTNHGTVVLTLWGPRSGSLESEVWYFSGTKNINWVSKWYILLHWKSTIWPKDPSGSTCTQQNLTFCNISTSLYENVPYHLATCSGGPNCVAVGLTGIELDQLQLNLHCKL